MKTVMMLMMMMMMMIEAVLGVFSVVWWNRGTCKWSQGQRHILRELETDRQTDRQTDRERDREKRDSHIKIQNKEI